eukprot:6172109-Pleurochrysis_carterae.AAC.1
MLKCPKENHGFVMPKRVRADALSGRSYRLRSIAPKAAYRIFVKKRKFRAKGLPKVSPCRVHYSSHTATLIVNLTGATNPPYAYQLHSNFIFIGGTGTGICRSTNLGECTPTGFDFCPSSTRLASFTVLHLFIHNANSENPPAVPATNLELASSIIPGVAVSGPFGPANKRSVSKFFSEKLLTAKEKGDNEFSTGGAIAHNPNWYYQIGLVTQPSVGAAVPSCGILTLKATYFVKWERPQTIARDADGATNTTTSYIHRVVEHEQFPSGKVISFDFRMARLHNLKIKIRKTWASEFGLVRSTRAGVDSIE